MYVSGSSKNQGCINNFAAQNNLSVIDKL